MQETFQFTYFLLLGVRWDGGGDLHTSNYKVDSSVNYTMKHSSFLCKKSCADRSIL